MRKNLKNTVEIRKTSDIIILQERESNCMLLNFKIKNYKSFVEDTELSMVASSIREHSDTLINVNGINVLPLAALFGANGSGKSNFIKAFNVMYKLVMDRTNEQKSKLNDITSFIFNDKLKESPTEFEISLCDIKNNKEYRYGINVDNKKVLEEWLFTKTFSATRNLKEKCIFYRKGQKSFETDISVEEKKEIEFVNSLTNESELLITNLGKRGNSKYSFVYTWFEHNALVLDYSSSFMESSEFLQVSLELFNKNNNTLNKIIEMINLIDPSIKSIKIEKEMDSQMNEKLVPYSIHLDDKNKEKPIIFSSESCGTKKMFSFAAYLFYALKLGLTLFVDELDSKLHPLILRYIIKMFKDKNTNSGHGQLIFTSHNLICLDSKDLRRDEIWFVEKTNQRSSMFSLYDFKDESIRNDLSFGKHYLNGRFGAIPFNND